MKIKFNNMLYVKTKRQIKIKGLQTYSKPRADKYKPRESWSSNLNF